MWHLGIPGCVNAQACVRVAACVRAAEAERKSGNSWRGALPEAARIGAGGWRYPCSVAAVLAGIWRLGWLFCGVSLYLALSRLVSEYPGYLAKKSWRTSEIRRRNLRAFSIRFVWGGRGCGGAANACDPPRG